MATLRILITLFFLAFSGSPARAEQQDCEYGRNQCKPGIESYWQCVDKTCGNKPKSYKECDAGKEACKTEARSYWLCVDKECVALAEADAARNQSSSASLQSYTGGGTWTTVGLDSTVQERIMRGSPAEYLRCENRSDGTKPFGLRSNIPTEGLMLRCGSKDMCSCVCLTYNSTRTTDDDRIPIHLRSGQRTTAKFGANCRPVQSYFGP